VSKESKPWLSVMSVLISSAHALHYYCVIVDILSTLVNSNIRLHGTQHVQCSGAKIRKLYISNSTCTLDFKCTFQNYSDETWKQICNSNHAVD